jgi:hypothetical protein
MQGITIDTEMRYITKGVLKIFKDSPIPLTYKPRNSQKLAIVKESYTAKKITSGAKKQNKITIPMKDIEIATRRVVSNGFLI